MNQIPNIEEGLEKILDIIIEEWAVDICIEQEIEIGKENRKDLVDRLKKRLSTHHQQLQKAREEERAIWGQRLPEDTFSVTIEGRFGKRIVANRKFVSMKSINATDGKTLLLEAEACAHQILQSLDHSELDQEVSK